MPGPVALEALPPSSGDAPLAAVLLRDLAAALVAGRDTRPAGLDPAAAEVTDDGRIALHATTPRGSPTDLDHAALAAPELFAGVAPDSRSDVYAAALLTLSRYLGTPAVTVAVGGHRVTARMRLATQRQAQRTVPARLGALPAPFRAVFTQSVAKEPYLRPTPERLVALLDAALTAAGDDVEAAARTRLHRLVVLARAFEPATSSTASGSFPPVAAEVVHGPHHLPLRALPPALGPTRRFTRAALIAAVTVVATGGVAAAAVVGFRGDGRPPVPQAVVTPAVPTPSSAAPSGVSTPVATSGVVTAPGVAAPVAATVGPGDDGGNPGGNRQVTPRGGNGSGTSNRSNPGRSGPGPGGSSKPAAPPPPVNPPPVNPPPVNPPPADPPAGGSGTPSDPGTTPTDPGTTPTDPGTTAPPSDPGEG